MDVLRQEVQEFQERWNSMVLDITEDLKITCEEARTVQNWIAAERKAYVLLKKKINLQIRTIRSEYELLLQQDDRVIVRAQRLERDLQLHPLKTLVLAVEELQLKAEDMKLRVEHLLEQCQDDASA